MSAQLCWHCSSVRHWHRCTHCLVSLCFMLASALFATGSEVELDGRTFVIPDGFSIQRVAGSPLVDRPISADFDSQGRLYVTESSGTNDRVEKQLAEKPHRILRLSDTDGDGKFDQRTVFADKMMLPEGALFFRGSLYVAAPPQIWKFTDSNDDGIADRREVWFDGKTLTGCANDLHGPYAGPDGYIYWCKGAFAEQTYQLPNGKPFVTRAAHIFRRHPDGNAIEPVMTGGMDNPVELVFSPGGERFFTTTFFQHPGGGQRDGLVHAIYGGVYGKQHGVIDGHARTGGLMPVMTHLGAAAPSGLMRIKSSALDPAWQGDLLASLFNMNKVTRHRLIRSGATFATEDTDFVSSNDLDFHPTDVLEDRDGSILIVDTGGWYKLCCPTSQLHKPDVLGGIYRVRRSRSPEDSPQSIEQPQAGAPHELRCNSVWALCQDGSKDSMKEIRHFLTDGDAEVRQAAIHALSLHRDKAALPLLLEVLDGDDAHNQRVACEAIGRIGDAAAVPALLDLVERTNDRVLLHSAAYAVIEIGDATAIVEEIASRTGQAKAAAVRALEQVNDGRLEVGAVISLLHDDSVEALDTAIWVFDRHPEWSEQISVCLTEMVNDSGQIDRLTQLLSVLRSTPAIYERIDGWLASSSTPANVKRCILAVYSLSPTTDGTGTLSKLLAESPELTDSLLEMLVRTKFNSADDQLSAELQSLMDAEQLPMEQRLQAALVLSRRAKSTDQNVFELVLPAIQSEAPVAQQDLAIAILESTSPNPLQLERLAEEMKGAGVLQVNRLLRLFANQHDGELGKSLITALSQNSARASLNVGLLEQVLEGFPADIRHAGQQLVASETRSDQRAKLTAMLKQLPQGDERRGLKIFRSNKALCSACHSLGYLGGDIGPDLSRIGKIRSRQDLLESIAFPNLTFVRSYEPHVVVTADGQMVAGILRDQGAHEVVLVTTERKEVRIPRHEIDAIQPGSVSVMPAGLDANLSAQELADLVEFLQSRK